jgi:hypothetical protein
MVEGSGFGGKSMKQVAMDVAEGFTTMNPLILKKFDKDMIKALYEHLNKSMNSVRNLPVHFHDVPAMRMKNMKLQRLHNALIVLRNHAREKRIQLI